MLKAVQERNLSSQYTHFGKVEAARKVGIQFMPLISKKVRSHSFAINNISRVMLCYFFNAQAGVLLLVKPFQPPTKPGAVLVHRRPQKLFYHHVLLTLCYNIVNDSHTRSELNEISEVVYLKQEQHKKVKRLNAILSRQY